MSSNLPIKMSDISVGIERAASVRAAARASLKTESSPNPGVNRQMNVETTEELKKAERQGVQFSVGAEQLIRMIEHANKRMQGRNTEFEFSIHKGTKEIMVKVLDKDTGEVIREIPSEKVLDMVAKMWEMAGIFVDEKR